MKYPDKLAASEKQYEQVISVLLSGSGFHGPVPTLELSGPRTVC